MQSLFHNIRFKIIVLTMVIPGAILCTLLGFLCYSSAARDHIVINEVCSHNFSVIQDENQKYSNYAELYNPSSIPVSLTGFSLSDDKQELRKCSMDAMIIPAKGYVLIWLDDAYSNEIGHAGFNLSDEGGELYLSDSSGKILDSVTVPALSYNTSYARIQDNAPKWSHMTASANGTNNSAQVLLPVTLKTPVFSAESGFYEDAFNLTLTAQKNELIYYTLDGSDPNLDSTLYQEPIRIKDASPQENIYSSRTDLSPVSDYTPPFSVDKAVIVRAIAYDPDKNAVSQIATQTYFISYDNKNEYDGYPVISLISDPDNLFSSEFGIYCNGAEMENYINAGGLQNGELLSKFTDAETGEQWNKATSSNAFHSGKDWEREAVITYFDEQHQYCFTQNVGIRISGESTRSLLQKSFNIYARDIYDDRETFPYSFFSDIPYSSIKLRNGGSDNEKSKIMDPFLQELSSDRDISTQSSMPCVVFLNGEYWGIYNMRERYKEEYLSGHYGVNEKNIWLIDCGAGSIGDLKAFNAYSDMLHFISENDMSIASNYEEACHLLDMQSLIDFYCANLYIDNTDVSFSRNIALWRTAQSENNDYGDGRWRFMLYDLDGSINQYSDNTFETSEWWKTDFSLMDELLIESLMQNETFKKQFCVSFMDMANTNYSYDHVHPLLMQWKEQYQTQAIKSHQRFIDAGFTSEEYDGYIETLDEFFRERFPYITSYLAQELALSGFLVPVKLLNSLPEGGSVTINTTAPISVAEWTGQYFTDYSITFTASPEKGYRFIGWSGDITETDMQLEVYPSENGLTLQANFEKIR